MNYSSQILENAVREFSKLPSIGTKSALRLVLHMVKREKVEMEQFVSAINALINDLKFCSVCFNISDHHICDICNDSKRNSKIICVVESVRDVIAIEETGHFKGLYHVLGGVISPIDGVGIEDIRIHELISRTETSEIEELIMGISPTIEGDTTIFYISKILKAKDIKISLLSRGVAFGGELEYTDGLTLGRSIKSRIPYSQLNQR